jgi:deazaflavin-dependent oxidoreductase (nitroreductase family)
VSDFNQALIEDMRAHGGQPTSGPFVGRQVLILTTTGAKTGAVRSTPLAYSREGDAFVIVASKGGADTNPAWYANLLAHPVATVEVGGQTFRARARVTEGQERRRLYDQHASIHPGFRDYEQKTTRVIPVVVLTREASIAA